MYKHSMGWSVVLLYDLVSWNTVHIGHLVAGLYCINPGVNSKYGEGYTKCGLTSQTCH